MSGVRRAAVIRAARPCSRRAKRSPVRRAGRQVPTTRLLAALPCSASSESIPQKPQRRPKAPTFYQRNAHARGWPTKVVTAVAVPVGVLAALFPIHLPSVTAPREALAQKVAVIESADLWHGAATAKSIETLAPIVFAAIAAIGTSNRVDRYWSSLRRRRCKSLFNRQLQQCIQTGPVIAKILRVTASSGVDRGSNQHGIADFRACPLSDALRK